MHFFVLLFRSFSRCFSSLGMLLLSSISLRISASLSRHSSFSFAAADVVACISLVVLGHARASAVMEHDRTCLFDLVCDLCIKMFFWITFRMLGMLVTEWAFFWQSLSCPQVAAAAAAISCIDFVCIFFTSDSHERVWVLMLQTLPCSPSFLFVATSTGVDVHPS